MPWNGAGSYVLPPAYSPEVNGTIIDATRYNGLTTDVANGISNAVAKDGQNVPTANLPMGGFKHTGAADANAAGQYVVFNQATAVGSLTVNTLTVATALLSNGTTTIGNAGADAFTINSSAVSVPNGLNFDSNTLVIDAANNRVGVGVAPVFPLHVAGGGIIATLTDWNSSANTVFQLANPAVRFGVGYTAADQVELQGFNTSNAAKTIVLQRLGGNIQIGSPQVLPLVTNTTALGASGTRWSDVQSVLGNFSGQISSSASGAGYLQSASTNGSSNSIQVFNTSNTVASDSVLLLNVAGASGGDAYVRYNNSGVSAWSHGYDNDDGDSWVLSFANALGTNNVLRVTTSLNTTFPGGAVTFNGGNVDVTRAAGGSVVQLLVQNDSNTANSNSELGVNVEGASAGNPFFSWAISGVQAYVFGINNAVSDALVGSVGSTLGTNNWISVATNGAVTFPDADGVTVTGPLTASSGVTGALTGNASTATALQTGRTISITGDLAYTSPSFDGTGNISAAGTLATVNANVGSFGSSTSIPTFTVNAKGLITAASGNAVVAPAGTLTGATLAAGVTASSLTSVGTLTSLTVSGAAVFNGAVTLGDAAGDTLTIAPNAVTWSNNPTHSGNHTWSGTQTFNGAVTLGDAAGDTITFTGTPAGQVVAGTWTPTWTNVANVSSSTAQPCNYMRVGNRVAFSGRVSIVTTSDSTLTQIRGTLPIASNFAVPEDCAGTANRQPSGSFTSLPGILSADSTNDNILLEFRQDTGGITAYYYFSGVYEII